MKLQIVAVRDQAANAYNRPIFVNALGQATRSFTDEVNRNAQDNDLNKHPEDFTLWHLGEYDDTTGELIPMKPRQITTGKDCHRPTE